MPVVIFVQVFIGIICLVTLILSCHKLVELLIYSHRNKCFHATALPLIVLILQVIANASKFGRVITDDIFRFHEILTFYICHSWYSNHCESLWHETDLQLYRQLISTHLGHSFHLHRCTVNHVFLVRLTFR